MQLDKFDGEKSTASPSPSINQHHEINNLFGQSDKNRSSQKQLSVGKETVPLRLLVVEDNPGDFVLLKKYLQRTSILVELIHWAKRLSDVEEILKNHEVNAAFLDLTLPDSTGIVSFITLNNFLPQTPIIVLSGLSDMGVALETISLGAQDFLVKGEFDERLLAKSIQYSLERKKTLEKLKESNERFEYVTQATFDTVWDRKLLSKELYWAENFTTLFGHTTHNEFENFALWPQLLHPEDHARVTERLESLLQTNETNWVEEYRLLKANGQYSVVLDKAIVLRESTGKAYRMIGAIQDITRQKEEEHNLKLFQSVIVNSNDGVFITEALPADGSGPRIVFVNDACAQITGYAKESWMGDSNRVLYGPKSDTEELKRLLTAMGKWEPCEIEIIAYKKSGEEFWMNFSVVPIANERGRFTHWISMAKDVTERRRYTKAIEDQNVKLKEIAWLQSHVVRAPLARIMGLINVIDDYEEMKLTQKELLSHINDSAHELDGVIREIVAKASAIR